MAIDQSSTPATGARGRRQFPEGFHHDAQKELMRGAAPVTTRPFLPSSSPVRRSTSAARNGHRQRRRPGRDTNPNANYYGILADEEDEIIDTLDALDLESETRRIIAREKERMTTRADVLCTFAESIAACARKFDHGYAHAVANDFTRSLLHHWNQQKPAARPPTDNQLPRQKSVSFADVTKAAARQAPGDVHIAPTRRQPMAASNYTDRRILLRLKEGSSFFEKQPYQIRSAIFEKLTLNAQDVQDITKINTGWSVVARNQEIQKKILESQEQWGPNVDLIIAEKQVTWFTYLIKDFPNELRSYDETVLDFNATISDEIVAQTGQTPVQWRRSSKPSIDSTKTTLIISFDKPVRGNFRLLGLGAYSFLMTKPQRLVQCQNCWQFHSPVQCTATKTCRTCGAINNEHVTENCQTAPRCANCHGPHYADHEQCYARPKKVGNTYHKLSKSQKIHARKLGADDYRRQNMEVITQPLDNSQAHNNEATTNSNMDEVDTETADTTEEDVTTTPQEDCLPALGGDEDMRDTEQEQPQNNEGAMEKEDAELGRAEEAPDSQEHLERGEKETGNTAEHEATEEEGEVESDNSEDENDDDNNEGDNNTGTLQSHQHEEQPATNPKNVPRITLIRGTEAPATKGLRGRIVSRPTLLKKTYINADMARQIIPSETTNPSSDAPAEQEILANVDKGKEAHSAALQLAFLEGYNVVESTLQVLEDWAPPENCVVVGDMNAFHTSWQADRPASQDGNCIHEWTDRHDLHLLNEPGEATTMAKRKSRRSTIDLVFSNIPEASATVEVHLTTGSLHYTIGIEIPNREPAQTTPGKVRVITPDEIKAFGDHVGKAVKSLPTDIDSEAQIEDMARRLQEILQNSARACGRKAMALRKEKLERRDASDDITDGWQPAVSPTKEIPFARTIPTKEVEKAVLHTGNTTPGSDGITTRMLQAAWPHIVRPVTTPYNACLRLGHHPSVFKTAEVVMIPKLNKRNLSEVSTWRPISLLSCLSKGLERVIARRMAYAAIKYGILHPNQAGALPKRSAIDIVVSLIYDIEKALAAGQVATLVTEDVMGAFDAILRNRMILHLRQQGWPDFLIRWMASFLLDRLASVRYQDRTTPSARLRCGLPQGSPISPILYVLITAAIYYLSGAAQRYGYADDTAMLFIGVSLEDTARQANEAIAAMESWGRGEAIHFDPNKTEVMHFSRRKADHNQSPAIYHGNKEIRAATSMRWLGIWLDKKLTFNHHVDEWTQKARRVINHLRVMNNTVRGMAATAARRAAWAVAMPTLFHGLDAWLPAWIQAAHASKETTSRRQTSAKYNAY
ncbi:hypothetical protein MY5147_009717 [Beauveria neobassiana]